MRHKKAFNHLSRKSAHRKAMMANMASSLIEHKRINTTVAKAKALRGFIEPLITKSKNTIVNQADVQEATHVRRVVFSYLRNKHAVKELFGEVAPKVVDRPGGYTRIIKTGFRLGDGAEMCMIELVDFNETYTSDKKATSTRKRRSRRGGKKTAEAAATAEAPQAAATEEAVVEAPEAVEVTDTVEETAESTTAEIEAPAEEATEAEAPEAEVKQEEPKAEASDEEANENDKEEKAGE